MDYKHFNPESAETVDSGPVKADLLMQVEADHHAVKSALDRGELDRADADEQMATLDARWKRVNSAKSNSAARKAYHESVAAASEPAAPEAA